MGEPSVISATPVGNWNVVTTCDGTVYETSVTRIPPDGSVWTMGRVFSEEEAQLQHDRVIAEIVQGQVPGFEA